MTEILHNAAAAVDAPQAPESEQRPARPLTQRAKDYFIRTPSLWTFAVLIVLVVVFSVSSHGEFGTASNIKNILVDASLLMIVSVGMTLTIIAGGIDLSVGAVTIFTSVFAGLIMGDIGGNGVVPVLVGLVAGVGTGLAWGLINGTIVSYMGVAPLIATLGSLGMATGLALVISGGTDIATVPSLLTNIGNGSVIGVPYLVLIALAVALAGGIYLNGTRRGLYLYAIGSNREAATRTGVHVRKNLLLVYTIIGGLAGFAGYLSLGLYSTSDLAGHTTDNLQAIAAVVLGGTSLFGGRGGVGGTVAGVLIPVVLSNGFVILGVQPYWQQFAIGMVLVFAVYSDQIRRKRLEHA